MCYNIMNYCENFGDNKNNFMLDHSHVLMISPEYIDLLAKTYAFAFQTNKLCTQAMLQCIDISLYYIHGANYEHNESKTN